jgi:DegV family protein with EDD domain
MRVDWAVRNVRVFGAIKSVKYLVRSGRVSKLAGKLAWLFRLSPILTLDAEGKVQVVTTVFGATRARRKLMKIVRQEATDRQARFLVSDANAPDTAAEYVHQIRKYFGVEEVLTAPISPALGAHLGPGAAAVVFLSGCYRQGGLG